MAIKIIDRLEAVQIEIEHRRPPTLERWRRGFSQDTQELFVKLDAVRQPGQRIVERQERVLPLGTDQADSVAVLSLQHGTHSGHEDRRLNRQYPKAVGGKSRRGDGKGRTAEQNLRHRETR